MAAVRLTIVPDEMAAEVLCGRLRASGIKCGYRKTDVAAGSGTYGGGFSMAGPTEVLVDEHDLDEAEASAPLARVRLGQYPLLQSPDHVRCKRPTVLFVSR